MIARIEGGGVSGQAGALRLGIARALIELDPELRASLKKEGYPSRDAREKERRKYGLKKAQGAAVPALGGTSGLRGIGLARGRDVREREVRLDLEVLRDEHVHRPRRVGSPLLPPFSSTGSPRPRAGIG